MGLRDDLGSPCDKTWTGRHTTTCGHHDWDRAPGHTGATCRNCWLFSWTPDLETSFCFRREPVPGPTADYCGRCADNGEGPWEPEALCRDCLEDAAPSAIVGCTGDRDGHHDGPCEAHGVWTRISAS